MREIIEYDSIMSSGSMKASDKDVCKGMITAIKQGWQPLGPATIVMRAPNNYLVYQTIVKYKDASCEEL